MDYQPPVLSLDPEVQTALGNVNTISLVNKFGSNTDVDTATVPEDMWNGGGIYTGFPESTVETLQVFSSSASDTVLGVGARTLLVTGLDANWNVQTEEFTLNGTTPVTGTKTFRRVHTANVRQSGSSVFAVGSITIRHSTTTSNVFMVMPVGTNQSNNAAYTVPEGKVAIIKRIFCCIRGSATATVDGNLYIKEFGLSPRLRRPFTASQAAPWQDSIYGGVRVPAKTDIHLRITQCTANNIAVTGGYDLVITDA